MLVYCLAIFVRAVLYNVHIFYCEGIRVRLRFNKFSCKICFIYFCQVPQPEIAIWSFFGLWSMLPAATCLVIQQWKYFITCLTLQKILGIWIPIQNCWYGKFISGKGQAFQMTKLYDVQITNAIKIISNTFCVFAGFSKL